MREVLRVAASPTAPSLARQAVRELCCGLVDQDLVDTAELLISEVVTNAVLHGGDEISVAIATGRAEVSVAVSDDGERLPDIRPADLLATNGRGMRMVADLAADWGVSESPSGAGKSVWFRVA